MDERTCVSNRPGVESGLLYDQDGQVWAETADQVESRPEPMKLLNEVDSTTEKRVTVMLQAMLEAFRE